MMTVSAMRENIIEKCFILPDNLCCSLCVSLVCAHRGSPIDFLELWHTV